MADINGCVTRKEFYAVLIVLWLFISLGFKPGGLQPWAVYFYWGVSLATALAYSILVFRGRNTNKVSK